MVAPKFDKALVSPTGYRNHMELQRYDLPAPLLLRQHTSDESVYRQVFETPHYSMRFEYAPTVIIDAGAHCGYASVFFAHRFPKARIIALEPAKDNFELLHKNTEPYPNITAINAALWHRDCLLTLFDPERGTWGYRVVENSQTGDTDARSIPSLIEEFDLTQIDLLKVDIEGAEREVFHDAKDWIDSVQAIVTELHEPIAPGSSRSFFNATNEFDYEWFCLESSCVTRGQFMQPPEGLPIAPAKIPKKPD